MFRLILITFFILVSFNNIQASMTKDELTKFIDKSMSIGKKDETLPMWEILDKNKELHSFIFETFDLAPIAGFSGGKMNMLVQMDIEGNFLDVQLLEQDEPVFVSGLGVLPFVEFLQQYKNKSLKNSIKVGDLKSSGNTVYLDGVSKATASVKIANDSILASSIKIAKEKLSGVAPKEISHPKKDLLEKHTWKSLLDKNLVKNLRVTKEEAEKLFINSEYKNELLDDERSELFLDLYVADLTIPSIAKNLIKQSTQDELDGQILETEEAILILANGEHQILSDDFVRNTSPDTLEIQQEGFALNIRDGDYEINLLDGIPQFDQSLILQVDKRFDFDPSSPWILNAKVVRGNGTLYSTPVIKNLSLDVHIDKKYFDIKQKVKETPLWLSSIYEQKEKLIILTLLLIGLFIILFKYQVVLKNLRYKRSFLLLITLFFIGWYGQGQLSMVTILGLVKAVLNSQSLQFLLYDPFSLIIWFFVLISLAIWGRGTFCGWLCPYGVLQEFSHYIGRMLKFPRIRFSENLNSKLVYIKYIVLASLILSAIFAPNITEYLIEIEPFKTSITLVFDRQWPYVVYALFWLVLGMFLFKGFCRYFCPLGAFLSLMGRLQTLNWLPRRFECGNPCNNCHKSCNYQAIDKKSGDIKYAECFQCLDCVQIYSDADLCKILKKDAKKEKDMQIKDWRKTNG
ncbi:4Fe-4S binding protein [Poseidonibacter ostreae]|jgi:NosR/NirI family transcriptional regulator, nitrous oxide reductase regulator|uniref:4Fe-4S binding protein n=1 Tax=Poseidonibacter ostreae TaxID=2654171 RepID=A0A6L4WVR9_9BACT|nr:4Fe-4S binding protein [Poseidonibacter ostreae]KAB7890663.1 4Fe-4S binding protein [Poseidonibacter ostreae]KAB7892354.1 4Fe-4S binding protein [Poseidonibacter ostreae]